MDWPSLANGPYRRGFPVVALFGWRRAGHHSVISVGTAFRHRRTDFFALFDIATISQLDEHVRRLMLGCAAIVGFLLVVLAIAGSFLIG